MQNIIGSAPPAVRAAIADLLLSIKTSLDVLPVILSLKDPDRPVTDWESLLTAMTAIRRELDVIKASKIEGLRRANARFRVSGIPLRPVEESPRKSPAHAGNPLRAHQRRPGFPGRRRNPGAKRRDPAQGTQGRPLRLPPARRKGQLGQYRGQYPHRPGHPHFRQVHGGNAALPSGHALRRRPQGPVRGLQQPPGPGTRRRIHRLRAPISKATAAGCPFSCANRAARPSA